MAELDQRLILLESRMSTVDALFESIETVTYVPADGSARRAVPQWFVTQASGIFYTVAPFDEHGVPFGRNINNASAEGGGYTGNSLQVEASFVLPTIRLGDSTTDIVPSSWTLEDRNPVNIYPWIRPSRNMLIATAGLAGSPSSVDTSWVQIFFPGQQNIVETVGHELRATLEDIPARTRLFGGGSIELIREEVLKRWIVRVHPLIKRGMRLLDTQDNNAEYIIINVTKRRGRNTFKEILCQRRDIIATADIPTSTQLPPTFTTPDPPTPDPSPPPIEPEPPDPPPTPDPTPDPPTPDPGPPPIVPPAGWTRWIEISYKQLYRIVTVGGQSVRQLLPEADRPTVRVPRWKVTQYPVDDNDRTYRVAPFTEDDQPLLDSSTDEGYEPNSLRLMSGFQRRPVRIGNDPNDQSVIDGESRDFSWQIITNLAGDRVNPTDSHPWISDGQMVVEPGSENLAVITESNPNTYVDVWFHTGHAGTGGEPHVPPPPPEPTSPYADGGDPPTGWFRSIPAVTYQQTDGTRIPVPRWKITASNGMRNGYKVAPFGADNEPILRTAGGFMGPNSIQVSGFPTSIIVRFGDPNRTDGHFEGGLFSFEFVRTTRNQAAPINTHPWFFLVNKDYNVSMLHDNQPPGQSELATLITEDPMSYMDLYFQF